MAGARGFHITRPGASKRLRLFVKWQQVTTSVIRHLEGNARGLYRVLGKGSE